jgi:hypothetical protein
MWQKNFFIICIGKEAEENIKGPRTRYPQGFTHSMTSRPIYLGPIYEHS